MAMTGLLPSGVTVVQWISADGRVLPLHGPAARDVFLGEGVEGLGDVEVDSLFESAARQHGETWVGYRLDHGEIELPVTVLAPEPEELRRRCDDVKSRFERFRTGWLASYSSTRGWRWVQARRRSMRLDTELDPHRSRHATYELVLIAESPLAREADDTDEWVNTAGSGRGQLHLYPGEGEWAPWPQFILRGPGRFRLRWAGNDVEFPMLRADEWALVNTDEVRPTIRGRDARGVERNLWPLMKPGVKIERPLAVREVSRVDIEVAGGSAQSSVWATVPVQHEGLV